MKNMEHAFVNKCVDEHWGDIIDAIENGHSHAATTIYVADGWVDIVSGRRGDSAVTVHHDYEENQRKCPLLCEAIDRALPGWAEVKKFYESGDEEEDDNGLDPAFSSWEDYLDDIIEEIENGNV